MQTVSHRTRRSGVLALWCLIGLAHSAGAQSNPIFIGSVVQIGSEAVDMPALRSVKQGDVPYYIAGSTRGVLGGSHEGGWDVFLRSEASGPWSVQFGSPEDDVVLALDHDAAGGGVGAYIAGYTGGELTPGAHLGGLDAFIARYDRDGNKLWLRQFGTPEDDIARDIAHGDHHGFYVVGSTAGALAGGSAGGDDAFIARYDSDGNQLWIRQFGGPGDDSVQAVHPVWSGGVYIAGNVSTAAAGTDIFVARYDASGGRLWYREFGSSGDDFVSAATGSYILNGDSLFIGGSTTGDLGGTNAGSTDAWVSLYDSDGNRIWLTQFGTPGPDEVLGLEAYNVYGVSAVGRTTGSIGSIPVTAGGSDAFIARIDPAGMLASAVQFGTSGDDAAVSISSNHVIGFTEGELGAVHQGDRDIFQAYVWERPCYPNCDSSYVMPMLNVDDFTCFVNTFTHAQSLPEALQASSYANCDQSSIVPVLNVDDFTCFINAFAQGCR